VGEGRGSLALIATSPATRVGEIALAAATVVAVIALAAALPAIMRGRRGRAKLTPALVLVTGGAAITFVSYLAFAIRCTQAGCTEFGSGQLEWWRVRSTWEWGAQLALASLGLAIGTVSLALAARGRRGARVTLNLARVVYLVWIVAVFLMPAVWEIFVIR
jgi:hypothetical protein